MVKYFPWATVFRASHKSKTTQTGGVFIMIRADLICTELSRNLKLTVKSLWVKLGVKGVHPLFICAYSPKESNQEDRIASIN